MFGMLSVLTELQLELIVANTNNGLACARARGPVGGSRPRLTDCATSREFPGELRDAEPASPGEFP